MVLLDGSFDGSNDGKLEVLFYVYLLVSTDGIVPVSDEGIKLGSSNGKVICIILGKIDGITLGLDIGTELGSLDGSFDCFNDAKYEGLLLGGSLVSIHGKSFGFDEGIKLGSTGGKVLVTIVVY